MEHNHPSTTIIALALAGTLLVAGALVFARSQDKAPSSVSTWGSTGTLIPSSFDPEIYQTPENPFASLLGAQGHIGTTQQQPRSTTNENQTTSVPTAEPVITQSEPRTSLTLEEIFSYLPWGKNDNTVTPQKNKTPQQQELYSWANRIGGLIEDFENTHASMNTMLDRFLSDRSTENAALVRALARDYRTLAEDLGVIQPPDSVSGLHQSLAKSYTSVGNGLDQIAQATDDDSLLAAINNYGPTARSHVQTYLGIVDILSVSQVQFNPGDPGAMFVFNSGL